MAKIDSIRRQRFCCEKRARRESADPEADTSKNPCASGVLMIH